MKCKMKPQVNRKMNEERKNLFTLWILTETAKKGLSPSSTLSEPQRQRNRGNHGTSWRPVNRFFVSTPSFLLHFCLSSVAFIFEATDHFVHVTIVTVLIIGVVKGEFECGRNNLQ